MSPLYRIAPYLPRTVLLQLYTMYVRPHIDYCDTVYGGNMTMFDRKRLDRAQNRAARLITGTSRRTTTEGLMRELGWTRSADRRRIHRLLLCHKLIHYAEVPAFIKATVPQSPDNVRQRTLRNRNNLRITPQITRTASYSRSFIPNTTLEWNDLPAEHRSHTNHKDFKKSLIHLMGPEKPDPYFSFGSKLGNTLHTKMKLNASYLNCYRFTIGLIPAPTCPCGHNKEDNDHYVLRCPLYVEDRGRLFRTLTTILGYDFTNLSTPDQIHLLLQGPRGNGNSSKDVAIAF